MTLPTTIAQRPAIEAATLPLSEVFGPTFQGEGPHTGRRCGFVRLGLCNLSCEWCDTPYTWDSTRYDVKAECPDTVIGDIAAQVRALGVDLVVLSGGEPLMHRLKLRALFGAVPVAWHVETNGTIPPPSWWHTEVEHTTVSPKINTRDRGSKRLKADSLGQWAALARNDRAAFKFVVTSADDLDIVANIARTYHIPKRAVWVMPEGVTTDAVLSHHRELADAVLSRGYNTSTRLHVLLWGDVRGV